MMMTSEELTVTITGLLPFTNYSITVQACSEAGCGPQSAEIIALTNEEGKNQTYLSSGNCFSFTIGFYCIAILVACMHA
jgi:hypothetical protein